MLQKFQHFFGRDEHLQSLVTSPKQPQSWRDGSASPPLQDWSTRRVGVGLPRQATFRRQNSERRERLCPVEPGTDERRAMSASRNASVSRPEPRSKSLPPQYAPVCTSVSDVALRSIPDITVEDENNSRMAEEPFSIDPSDELAQYDDYRPPRPLSRTSSNASLHHHTAAGNDRAQLNAELDSKWILNLSMHFRDKSDREKFFVTYAERPNKWRRVTVSCDYRNAEPGSLERDLKELQFQRDKSLQIYESIRDSLPEIQFYDTVTNLKLETSDGRLHVHVTEDANEIISYPSISTVAHILDDDEYQPMEIRESDLSFDSHLSGFVYKVSHSGRTYIKKEIPGPDTIDEFLYEVNALHALSYSDYVVRLEGIVVDDSRQIVKGLLISYAEQGAIVDLLYDHKDDISWERRQKWAQQAVQGLSDIHEEGYVQGDFTLSNIVVDEYDNAKIIDINRRGCPVGWEPPEIARKIASNQRISMYIGEKSDLYQLGMTLWALAMNDDEPERHDPPLSVAAFPSEVPSEYQDIVRICLSSEPRRRLSAKQLLEMFPTDLTDMARPTAEADRRPRLACHTERFFFNPESAVEREDIERFSPQRQQRQQQQHDDTIYSPHSSWDDHTFTYPRSSNYEFDSASSAFERPRGRRLPSDYEGSITDSRYCESGKRNTPFPRWEEDEMQLVPDATSTNPLDEAMRKDCQVLPGAETLSRSTSSQNLDEHGKRSDHNPALSTCTNPTAIELDHARPRLVSWLSETSASTPRHSQATIPQVTPIRHLSRPDCLSTDFSGRSTHPALAGTSAEQHQSTNTAPETSVRNPPSLPYADSGYDEPLGFTGLGDHSFESCAGCQTEPLPADPQTRIAEGTGSDLDPRDQALAYSVETKQPH